MRNFVLAILIFAATIVPTDLEAGSEFLRGDANLDGTVDLSDAVRDLQFLFGSIGLDCESAADANDSGGIDIADPIHLLSALFENGAPIPAPFPLCGTDPTPDALDCSSYPLCGPHEGRASYSGPAMVHPRYGHTATKLDDGLVLIVGGTDARHLSAIAAVELFDESAGTGGALPPGMLSGDFIDQDINGDLISLPGDGRFFHTANLLADGRVVVIGGTSHVLTGTAAETTLIFDPLLRQFSAISLSGEIEKPRVRHTTHRLFDGRLLVSGGQRSEMVLNPGIGILIPAYASERSMEFFDPVSQSFSPALDVNLRPSQFTNSRGRTGHTDVVFGGVDGLLSTPDDIVAWLGGFQTLSPQSGAAPQDLMPWSLATTSMTHMDFIDLSTQGVNLAQGLVLSLRINDPIAINLGRDHPATPFGDTGMTNIVLVQGGDSNTPCPAGSSIPGITTDQSELIIATFTGFGPASGARFTGVAGDTIFDPANSVVTSTAAYSHEGALVGCAESFHRSGTQAVLMDMLRTYDNQSSVTSVVVTGGGASQSELSGTCSSVITRPCDLSLLDGFMFFDPFFDITQVGSVLPLDDDVDNDGIPDLFPWTFANNGSLTNPLGIRGGWLNYDASIPDNTIVGYADGVAVSDSRTVPLREARTMHTLTRIAGADGLDGTLDDRVLVVGGSTGYFPLYGDLPCSISCEVFLPPDAAP